MIRRPLLHVEDRSIAYGETPAVHALSFALPAPAECRDIRDALRQAESLGATEVMAVTRAD